MTSKNVLQFLFGTYRNQYAAEPTVFLAWYQGTRCMVENRDAPCYQRAFKFFIKKNNKK